MAARRVCAALSALLFGIASTAAIAETRPPVSAVLELFTSQGCSSCPPADELLEHFSKRPGVIALSFPVDYWDYLGWKDTLANHAFTQRQKSYGALRGDRQVYTPQVIVGGQLPVVGSDKAAIEAAIAKATPPMVPIAIGMKDGSIRVTIGSSVAADARQGTIWLALYDRRVTVPVNRGENSGRDLDYYNVVRKFRPIAMWKGQPMTVDLPMSEYHEADANGCAVLLQQEGPNGAPGTILGAAHAEQGDAW